MKIGIARSDSERLPVLFTGETWIDLGRALHAFDGRVLDDDSILALIRAGELHIDFFRSMLGTLEGGGVHFTVPAPERFAIPFRPGKIVALGRNYAAHARELGNAVPEEPLIFSKSPTACIGDGDPVVVRPEYGRVDYEAELAVVMGKRATRIREEEARGCVAGYTLLNDVTARDMQSADKERGLPWFRSKNPDTFCPIGPVVSLTDAVAWPVSVDIALRVNGETRQRGSTNQFIFSIPQMLAYISNLMTLEPGDLVATGTPEGVGPVTPGDTMEIEVSEIGVLHNPVTFAE